MENSDKLALHAILIKKPCPLETAQEVAQEFIKDNKKKFYRETKNYYRFRNIPKSHFMPKCYKTKKINNKVSIIIGKLKPEYEHLEGSGMLDFFKKKASDIKQVVKKVVQKVGNVFTPRLDSYNNTSRKTIEQYGDLPIKSLTICRTPIMKILDTVINFLSLNKFSDLKKKYGFDELYHLQLVANVGNKNIVIEKNEVININTSFKNDSKTETYQVPLKTMSGSGSLWAKYEADMARRKAEEPERLRLEQVERERRDAEYDARQAEWQKTDSYKYMQRKKEEAAAEKKLWDDAGKKTKKTGGANNQPLTINEILEKGRQRVGDHLWFSYDAFTNNCQYFIKYCLEGVNLYDESAKNFLFQDIEELAKEMPQYVKATAKALTTTGAVANKLMGKAKLKKYYDSDSDSDSIHGGARNYNSKKAGFFASLAKGKNKQKPTQFRKYNESGFMPNKANKLSGDIIKKLDDKGFYNFAVENGKKDKGSYVMSVIFNNWIQTKEGKKFLKAHLNNNEDEENDEESEEEKDEKKPETNSNKEKIIENNKEVFKIVDRIIKISSPFTFNKHKKKLNLELVNCFEKMGQKLNEVDKKEFLDNFAEIIKDSSKTHDFYPTPMKILEPFEDFIKYGKNILEPTAGLGYIINYIREVNPNAKITAIEYNSNFHRALTHLNPDINIDPKNKDFLKYDPEQNNFDLIVMNPPFTHRTDIHYYLDFVFHSLYLMNKSTSKTHPTINLIVPQLSKNIHQKDFVLMDIINFAGKKKMKSILERYKIEMTPKELDLLFKEDLNNEKVEKIINMFDFFHCQFVSKATGFSGTKISVNMYTLSVYR